MNRYRPVPPKSRPGHCSHAEWDRLLQTTPHCARYLRGECESPCSLKKDSIEYPVDLDHVLARSKGGTGLQWLCSDYNRWEKGVKDDTLYGKQLWFDQEPDVSRLRRSQLERAWNVVVNEHPEFFRDMPDAAYKAFLLLAWVVGAGKTMGIVATLLGINNVINREASGQRRISKALILVHQRTLVESLAKEIAIEPTQYGIVTREPRVLQIASGDDWSRVRSGEYDFAVACTQSIWDGENRILSREKLEEKLAVFEAVVVDECQFAVDRYRELIDMMPRAFKFSMSATPMNFRGEFLNEQYPNLFVMMSQYSYEDGRKDGYLKELLEYHDGVKQCRYVPYSAGDAEEQRGNDTDESYNTSNPNNVRRDYALLNKVASDVSSSDDPGYDEHVMVRVGSIRECKALANALHGGDSGHGILSGFGRTWRGSAIFSGSKGKQLSDTAHPWMRAKRNKKRRCVQGSERLVVVVDIGQFGINNPNCTAIVWLAPNISMVELVQRIGRALRKDGIVRLYWHGRDEGMSAAIERAVDYILNMEQRLEEAGFVTIDDFLEDQKTSQTGPIISIPLLSKQDRGDIDRELGRRIMEHGEPISEESISETIDAWEDHTAKKTPGRREAARRHAESMREQSYRRRHIGIPSGDLEPEPVVIYEEPPTEYSDEELDVSIDKGLIAIAMDAGEAKALYRRDKLWRDQFNLLKHEHDKRFFTRPHVFTGIDVTLKGCATEIMRGFGLEYSHRIYGALMQAVNTAAARHFGLERIGRVAIEPHEAEYVDALNRQRTRAVVYALARAIFLRRNPDIIPEYNALYAEQIEEVAEFVGDDYEDRETA